MVKEKIVIPIGYVEAKKSPNGKWKLFFRGTRNEVFPGEVFNTASEAKNYLKVIEVKQGFKESTNMPIQIPERVLAWRERLRKGSIMKPKTFKGIKGKAGRAGYRTPSAVAGKAYYVTLLSRYLESHPRDVGVRRLLSSLVKRRTKKIKNPIKRPKRHSPLRLLKKYEIEYLEEKLGKGWGLMPKSTILRVLRRMKKNPSSQPVVIYDRLLGIEAQKRSGQFKGENFRHDFKNKTDAVVLGNPDGSLTIRSTKGKRLWKKFKY